MIIQKFMPCKKHDRGRCPPDEIKSYVVDYKKKVDPGQSRQSGFETSNGSKMGFACQNGWEGA